ncbi:hypothetical protein BDA96_05G191000 [Sorghum bicolor]|uniref:DUF7054 domain-containing protein n=1 Tax=Sorghum bicolor TaxID=4558 RepID=A0A921QY39_SORBI|nr:hypothetical protein BDA96_05G191000 [Sorghum bicolor]
MSKSKQAFLLAPTPPPTPPVQETCSEKSRHRTTNQPIYPPDGIMRALMVVPEQRNSRPRQLAGVRVGRSPAAASPSRPRRRRRKSGSSSTTAVQLGPSRSRTRSRREGKSRRMLARSASEPALWLGDARVHAVPPHAVEQELDCPPSPPPPPLERPHTCFDVFAPEESAFGRSPSAASLTKLCSARDREEAKVVVSVTVEGSVGPVKAMVRLGASVGEAIAAVLERYAREGRSPRLDPAAAQSFQLHHSHFSLQSLNKSDKIGDVGGRNFYLHKNDSSNGLYLQGQEPPDVNSSCSDLSQNSSLGQPSGGATKQYQVLTIVISKLDKIGRRTRRIWRFITCNNCS